jgi:hypothetical protein
MSDALSYATATPGVPASRYGRRLRQRDFNNASETFTVLETPSSSVAPSKKGEFHALPAPLHPQFTPLLAFFKYRPPSKTHKLRPCAAA